MSAKQDRISGSCASRASPHSNLSRSDLENLRSLFEPLRGMESEEQSKKDHQDYPKDNYLLPIHPAPPTSSDDVNYEVPTQRPETYGSKRSATPSFGTFGENPLEAQIGDKLEKIYGTYDKRREYHRRSDRRREQEYRNQEVATAEERLLRANYGPEEARPQEGGSKEMDEYQYQKQRHLAPYHHRHYHPQKVHGPSSHHHPSVSINYQKHPHGSNPTVVYRDDSCASNVYETNYQRHRNPRLPSNYHGAVTPSMMSATSSNSSLINHGSSPTMHYRIGETANSSSASPATLLADEQGNDSPCDLRHLPNSSNASYDSSVRSHSRMDHVQEHLHHHHRVQYSQKGLRERLEHPEISEPPPPPTPPSPMSMNHHINQHHNHNSASNKASQTKSPGFIGYNDGQVSTVPSKSKCQCHTLQEGCRDKRETECRGNGDVEVTSITHQPPALPPRPPPRTARRYETVPTNQGHVVEGTCCKKYVILCSLCGGLSAAVGSLFLAVHAVLSAHTASLALFETVPSYIPGTMLIIMGFFTMLLARRKHRCGLLMKVCGSVGVVCALVCVLVTVTTTVVHMSRLQGLRQCIYTVRARSCTCYEESQSKGDPGVLFEETPHCEVVHGALYACLRALFGVSVAGILACIFSCMLVYQLLSHEKKKMYWEQLELRCRSLYGQGMAVTGVGSAVPGSCGCCNDCGGGAGAWWTQTQGNLYTPNPDLAPSRRWRLPWTRSRGPATNPDSNYGFHAQQRQVENNTDNTVGPYSVLSSQAGGPYSVLNPQSNPYTPNPATYSVLEAPVPLWGPPPPYSDPNSPARRPHIVDLRQQRITKRIENYDNNEPVDYRARVTNKRPSDNYENAEDLANSTDPEGGNDGTVKSRRIRKPLKGVENCAFQQESSMPKQSESELYFGDVSSCCGPESSFYDVALDNEGEQVEIKDHMPSHGKRQLSTKSRHSIHPDMPSNSYSNNEERNGRTSYLAPDAQYEVIQQGHYSYYSPKSDDEDDSMGDPNQETREPASEAREEAISAKQEIRESKRKNYYQDRNKERKSNHHSSEQCCDENADWQAEQNQAQQEEDACHSNNV